MSFRLEPIPAFSDNYIWCLSNDQGQALIVDPGEADPVLDYLEQNNLQLNAIFLTHHHFDHSGGIDKLRERFPVPVYGPVDSPCGKVSVELEDSESAVWDGLEFRVIAIPGHTLDHIAFFCADERLDQAVLFCGDTLFVGGCGRLFEGSPEQMQRSLARLRALPDETLVCCAHEYTLANLAFAQAVEPENQKLSEFQVHCQQKRDQHQPTVPGRLELEKEVNPFIRWDAPAVCEAAIEFGYNHGLRVDPAVPETIFAAVRLWKDQFRG